MNIYAEMLNWTLTNYHRLKTDIEPNINDDEKRRRWTERADIELTALHKSLTGK